MTGARTKLFHAIVGLGLTSAMACTTTIEQAAQGTSGGTGGAGGQPGSTGGQGGAHTTSTSGGLGGMGMVGSAGGGLTFDAGDPTDANQTWDVVPIK